MKKIKEIWDGNVLLGHVPEVQNFFYLNKALASSPQLDIGDYTYVVGANFKVSYMEPGTSFTIGKFCSVSGGVSILLGGLHDASFVSTYPFYDIPSFWPGARDAKPKKTNGNVVIGNDVCIGRQVTIMSGVTIGDGAVIGALSLVTNDIGPYEIWGGNPAQFIRKRFDDETIAALLRIKWWDWSEEKIEENVHLLASPSLKAFIEKHDVMHEVV